MSWIASFGGPKFQVLFYTFIGLSIGLLLAVNIRRCVELIGVKHATVWTCASLVVLHFIEPNFFGNLTYTLWSGLVAATLIFMRHIADTKKPHLIETGLMLICFGSQPISLGLVPGIIILMLYKGRSLYLVGVLSISAILASMIYLNIEEKELSHQLEVIITTFSGLFSFDYHHYDPEIYRFDRIQVFRNFMFVLGVLISAASFICLVIDLKNRKLNDVNMAVFFVLLARWGVLALYIISPRLEVYYNLHGRYMVVYVQMTMLLALWLGVRFRGMSLSFIGRYAAWAILSVGILHGIARGPINVERIYRLYTFLDQAGDYRETCTAGDVLALSREPFTPIYLCKRETFAQTGIRDVSDIAASYQVKYLFEPERDPGLPLMFNGDPM
jgi:hypothetical protein